MCLMYHVFKSSHFVVFEIMENEFFEPGVGFKLGRKSQYCYILQQMIIFGHCKWILMFLKVQILKHFTCTKVTKFDTLRLQQRHQGNSLHVHYRVSCETNHGFDVFWKQIHFRTFVCIQNQFYSFFSKRTTRFLFSSTNVSKIFVRVLLFVQQFSLN